ncbi:class I SAM-dependent methyltransferase [Proteiniclasticum sp. C24MP]|uniref:class I SAM-dependent methyltransferase n=1 Tax=Proteiniclasticum sp. C24MP TaxID=3374101 RepID=UPI0037548423
MKKENPFDNEVRNYEEWFKINDQLLESELDAIYQVLPSTGTGIEIGVGTGIFASRTGVKFGIEPSQNMAEEAIRKGICVTIGTAEDLPAEDAAFDYAMMITVDCFLSDLPKAFEEIHRILKPDGILIIAFLDKATPLGALYEKNKHLHESYKDAVFHTSSEMEIFLEQADFIVQAKYQTIFSLENIYQKPIEGSGDGIFCVFSAKRK